MGAKSFRQAEDLYLLGDRTGRSDRIRAIGDRAAILQTHAGGIETILATPQQVKDYLAYWLQLGKGIVFPQEQSPRKPDSVLQGDRFSEAFERCWEEVQAIDGKGCYLEGTDVTLDQLLSPRWEIDSCARCGMAVPTPTVMYDGLMCPCSDVEGWPNDDLPRPRLPQNSQTHLKQLSERLLSRKEAN